VNNDQRSTEEKAKDVAGELVKLAIDTGCIEEGEELDLTLLTEKVQEIKDREAKAINKSLQTQIEYLVGYLGAADGQIEIEDVLKDYAMRGMVECSVCEEREFEVRATKKGQGWVCRRCTKPGTSN